MLAGIVVLLSGNFSFCIGIIHIFRMRQLDSIFLEFWRFLG